MIDARPLAAPWLRHASLAVLGFLVFHTWFWSPLLFGEGYLAHSDLYEYFLPVFLSPPTVWSSQEFAGFPAFADPQNAAWYPIRLLFSEVLDWWSGFIVSAYVIASLGAYWYVFLLTRSVPAAVLAGVSWPLSEALSEKYPHLAMLHAYAWLPVVLACVERLAATQTWRWAAMTAAALATLVLTGHAQAVVYCAYLIGVYAVVLWLTQGRSRRLALLGASVLALGALLTAAQTLPLLELSGLAARIEVGFEQFANSHAKTPSELLTALVPQIRHEGREAPTYTGVVTLAGAALLLAGGQLSWRMRFWLVTAVICLLLGLGGRTPLADVAYHVPLYDKFRIVARHLALYSFAMIVLGTSGIAAMAALPARRARVVLVGIAVGVAAAFVYVASPASGFNVDRDGGLVWLVEMMGSDLRVQASVWTALLLTIAAVTVPAARRTGLTLLCVMAVVDLAAGQPEPVTLRGARVPSHLPAALIEPSVHTESLRERLHATAQRFLPLEGSARDPFAMGVFARVWDTPSVGGYGPLLLERLARLTGMDANGAVRPATLLSENRALDVLATRFVIVPRPMTEALPCDDCEGTGALELAVGRADCGQGPPSSLRLALPPVAVTRVTLITHLRCAEDVTQDYAVGTMTLAGRDGSRAAVPLRAGIETAEAYAARPELAGRLRHKPAVVFASDGEGNDIRTSYRTEVPLALPVDGGTIEFQQHMPSGWLTIDRVIIHTRDGRSMALVTPPAALGLGDRFAELARVRTSRRSDRGVDEEAADEQEYVIYENRQSRPRAWLVAEALPLGADDAAAALRHSRLPDGRTFDPARLALVPTGTPLMAPMVGEGTPLTVNLRHVESGRVALETDAPAATMAVLSEMWYPGWRATVDGVPSAVVRVNELIMGTMVPPGRHLVEFSFESTSRAIGIALSAAALAMVAVALAVGGRRD